MKFLPVAVLALGLAACQSNPYPTVGGGTPRPGTAPITNAAGSAQGAPQSANSLPAGTRVNSPLASPTGSVGTTPVR